MPFRRYILHIAGCVGLIAILSGCASSALGVRGDFHQTALRQVVLAPIVADTSFLRHPSELARITSATESTIREVLSARGISVVTTTQLTADDEPGERWRSFHESTAPRPRLERLFEPDDSGRQHPAAAALSRLAPSLPTPHVLFAEVIYQTSTTCRVKPDPSPMLTVEPHGAPLPAPCAVSHVAFKLVDAHRGETMWYNQVLLEQRADSDKPNARDNLARCITQALAGARGLPRYFALAPLEESRTP